ncbi:hypothetical protein T12_3558 [Trichinella patagoniensis]|uniref:Uncharacterized protein n=1 Tax=Trichinella patagoniensis TaxID=990121 RepID=A0A0V1AET8_9BILA|nr:hypothetical protein T12_3558 [Trichinella patagoniensis]
MGCLVQERTLNEKRTMSACRCQRFTLKYSTVTLSLLRTQIGMQVHVDKTNSALLRNWIQSCRNLILMNEYPANLITFLAT